MLESKPKNRYTEEPLEDEEEEEEEMGGHPFFGRQKSQALSHWIPKTQINRINASKRTPPTNMFLLWIRNKAP